MGFFHSMAILFLHNNDWEQSNKHFSFVCMVAVSGRFLSHGMSEENMFSLAALKAHDLYADGKFSRNTAASWIQKYSDFLKLINAGRRKDTKF